jgi:hypothetical protein
MDKGTDVPLHCEGGLFVRGERESRMSMGLKALCYHNVLPHSGECSGAEGRLEEYR